MADKNTEIFKDEQKKTARCILVCADLLCAAGGQTLQINVKRYRL